jgi:predicted RNase H-like nuclease
MTRVAGADGTLGGWAVVIVEAGRSYIRKMAALSDVLNGAADFDIFAVDVPIGLLDAYEPGGRACDRAARKLLGRPRASGNLGLRRPQTKLGNRSGRALPLNF